MDTTGPFYGLPCPGPNDAAALPLYMQRLAETIEADQVEQRARISAAYRPKAAVWRKSVSAISSGGSVSFTFAGSDLIFYNYLNPLNGGPPTLGEFEVIAPQAGVWRIGWSANTQATGAVTSGSVRQMNVGVGRTDPDSSTNHIIGDASRYVQETQSVAATGDFFSGSTMFVVDNDFDRVSCIFRFTHSNAASTVAIVSITAWLRYVGSIEPIEVV